MNLVFLGAPGVGKGTQADKLAAQFGMRKISTGDLLREAVRKGTELGREAKSYMDQGRLVPDSVVIGLVKETLAGSDTGNGFILDGFPRTVPQAQALEQVLDEQGIRLDRVINFRASRDEIVKRLGGRRSCPICQATFHLQFSPSQRGDFCDRCGGKLVQRSDDQQEAIETRLKVYDEQTAPLISFYDQKKILSHLDSVGSIDAVYESLTKVLAVRNSA
ncbi:MAG: adenylate kinase [Nitrospira sp.]|nr:adenylate kinase [Nitrospira sp.]